MTTRDFTANVISASKVVPDGNFKTSKASGVWDINEALDLIKGGNWPNVANINPAAFVDALFSVDVWDGDGTDSNTITSGIDLSNKGGLLWIKPRNVGLTNNLFDTERGFGTTFGYRLISDLTNAQSEKADGLRAFNSNGFTLGNSTAVNGSSYNYVSWTFRKQPKFFDVVTYTGNFTAGKTVSHNLGSVPGMIIIKDTSNTRNWIVYHRSIGEGKFLKLNATDAEASNTYNFNNTAPTSTQFTLGESSNTNTNGATYVAYLFAHNNDDGGFGEPGDQDIIKCDTYTGNGSSTGPVVTLGFEPQFLMIKRAVGGSGSWEVIDTMRGFPVDTAGDAVLRWNSSGTENTGDALPVGKPTATGFQILTDEAHVNQNTHTYIYMAIRRGGMQTPTVGTDVFAIDSQGSTGDGNAPSFRSNFPVDMAIRLDTSGASKDISARLTGSTRLYTDLTNAESSFSSSKWDYQNGWYSSTNTNTNYYAHMWKRARGYFDVVAYTGTGAAQTINHNLGAIPEMIWLKRRDTANFEWIVYHKGLNGGTSPEDYVLYLNANNAEADVAYWDDTAPTSTTFRVSGFGQTGASGGTYIAYLFATAAGVSKIGSYTGTGSAQNIECGFSNGAKFVLIKKADDTGHWQIYDTTRGLVSGNDPRLTLNSTSAELTGYDMVDPYSGGFAVTDRSDTNDNGYTFIFYAIANDPS